MLLKIHALEYCIIITHRGWKELPVILQLFSVCLQSNPCTQSFIQQVFECSPYAQQEAEGYENKDGPCHLVITVAFLFYLSFLAPLLLSMNLHSSNFPGDLNFLEGDLLSHISLQFIFLGPAGRYC